MDYCDYASLERNWAVTAVVLNRAVTAVVLNSAVTAAVLNWAVTAAVLNWAVTAAVLNWAVTAVVLNWANYRKSMLHSLLAAVGKFNTATEFAVCNCREVPT